MACSGALTLAAAGVLDGHPATTHWTDMTTLRQGFPDVRVQDDRLHTHNSQCRDGDAHISASVGVMADISLTLALVEADLGYSLVPSITRRLVMLLKRPGGQAQSSARLTLELNRIPRPAALLGRIPANLAGDPSLEALAGRAYMGLRTSSRVFLQELGVTPDRYVEQVRLEATRALLQDVQASITTVSRLYSFSHPGNLWRTFHKHLSVSPQECTERFGMLV